MLTYNADSHSFCSEQVDELFEWLLIVLMWWFGGMETFLITEGEGEKWQDVIFLLDDNDSGFLLTEGVVRDSGCLKDDDEDDDSVMLGFL